MSWVKRHPLVAYFILAYAITWVLVLPLVASTQGLVDIQISPIWHFLGVFGPILAAFVVTGFSGGRLGAKELLGRMPRWRVGIGQECWWYTGSGTP